MRAFYSEEIPYIFLNLSPPGTTYRYYTSLEDTKCIAEGESAFVGIIKKQFCSDDKAGKECENDKFCDDDEICVCNTKCESYRCIKGSRKSNDKVKTNNGNHGNSWKAINTTGRV